MTPKSQISELGLRAATAAVLVPLVLIVTYLGGLWFQLLILLLAGLLANELADNIFSRRLLGLRLFMIAVFVGSGMLSILNMPVSALIGGLAGAVLCVALSKVKGSKAAILGGGMILGSAAGVALIALRSGPEFGLISLFWLFCVVWSADTMAYVSGRLIGGPKLAPIISPNKTWAGFFGGIAGAAAAGFLVMVLVDSRSIIIVTTISAVAAVFAQIGDLAESWAKRQLGVKDSGNLLPGHGGVWDRLDALILVAIFATVIGLLRNNSQSIAQNLMIW